MTDRVNALIVTLHKDIRDDDVEPLMDAIRQFRCVLQVDPNIRDIDSHVAQVRARSELGSKIMEVIYPERRDG